MTCIVDFDRTYLKNDFFQEVFFRRIIENPFFIANHFLLKRKSLLDLKYELLDVQHLDYKIDFLVNPVVHEWILANRSNYSKLVIVSATPAFFVKRVLEPLNFFDELHGSVSVNLKGAEKLRFIRDLWGNHFDYVGDSASDQPIFKAARNGYKITRKGLMHVKF